MEDRLDRPNSFLNLTLRLSILKALRTLELIP
jgi:hypothetical protein